LRKDCIRVDLKPATTRMSSQLDPIFYIVVNQICKKRVLKQRVTKNRATG